MPRGRSKAYGNRTDLNNPKIAVNAPTGMPYGENKALRDAQKAVPMGNPEMAVAEPPSVSPAPVPVTPVPLTAPTQRPNEDVLTGITQSRSQNPDLQNLKSLQNLFDAEAQAPDAPQIFKDFTEWLRNQ